MLADKYDFIYAAIGIHPHEVKDILHPAYDILRHFAQHKKVVAYGEIGLDYHYEHSPRSDQKRKFRDMLREARELELPVIVHDRDAHEDTLQILSEEWSPELGGVHALFFRGCCHGEEADRDGFFALHRRSGHVSQGRGAARGGAPDPDRTSADRDGLSVSCAPAACAANGTSRPSCAILPRPIAQIKGLSFDDVARITSFNAMQLFGIGTMPERGQITYPIRNSLYLNITNRCTAACTFCVRYHTDFVKGHNLRLAEEPSAEELIKEIGDPKRYAEIVFCGYGEPLLRLDVVKAVAAEVKRPGGKVRIDTNGHANLIHKRNVLPELAGLVDAVSVSLNAQNAELYEKVSQPQFGIATYEAVKEFIREAVKYIPDVTATVVSLPEVDR